MGGWGGHVTGTRHIFICPKSEVTAQEEHINLLMPLNYTVHVAYIVSKLHIRINQIILMKIVLDNFIYTDDQ